jgi:hypothetical protein
MKHKAHTKHGAIVECPTHKRKRTFKPKSTQPKTKCPVCWACWLSDRLETMLVREDLEDILRFSNAFTAVVKPTSIEYVETEKDE